MVLSYHEKSAISRQNDEEKYKNMQQGFSDKENTGTQSMYAYNISKEKKKNIKPGYIADLIIFLCLAHGFLNQVIKNLGHPYYRYMQRQAHFKSTGGHMKVSFFFSFFLRLSFPVERYDKIFFLIFF